MSQDHLYFSDWWRELKIAYHLWRARRLVAHSDALAGARHRLEALKLSLSRKPLMIQVLKEIYPNA